MADVTREAVEKWYADRAFRADPITAVIRALAHFAPPRHRTGDAPMSDEELAHELREAASSASYRDNSGMWLTVARRARELLVSADSPPRQRMLIEKMTRQEIEGEFLKDAFAPTDRITRQCMDHASHVAYRLANTPVLDVDPDARAKAVAWKFYCAMNADPALRSCIDPEENWHRQHDAARNGWRAVAAMERGPGGE